MGKTSKNKRAMQREARKAAKGKKGNRSPSSRPETSMPSSTPQPQGDKSDK